MIVGVHDDAGHKGCASGALTGEVYSQFLPMLSTISRAVDSSRACAGKENIGINRVDGQRPDRWQSPIGPIGGDAFPPRPAIAAHEQARIAAGENGMRLFGMGDQAWMQLLSGNGARCRTHARPGCVDARIKSGHSELVGIMHHLKEAEH
jgi:hypothetical protein